MQNRGKWHEDAGVEVASVLQSEAEEDPNREGGTLAATTAKGEVMKSKTGKGGGKMAPSMLKKGESGTARPAKGKVLAKPNEQARRMMDNSRTDSRGGWRS